MRAFLLSVALLCLGCLAIAQPTPTAFDYNAEGSRLFQSGKLDEAIPYFDVAIKMNPDVSAFHFNLGFTFFIQKRYFKAVPSLQMAIQLDSSPSAAALQTLASALFRSGYCLPL